MNSSSSARLGNSGSATKKKRNSSMLRKGSRRHPSSSSASTSSSSMSFSSNQTPQKIGDFRPYFVPIKQKNNELPSPLSQQDLIKNTRSQLPLQNNGGPARTLQTGLKSISVASFLREGVPVVKVSHNKIGKLRRRVLTLSEDQSTLFLTHSKLAKGTRNAIPKPPSWTPSKGWNGTYIRSVDVANICDFQVGVISSRWLELSIASYTNTKRAKEKKQQQQQEEEQAEATAGNGESSSARDLRRELQKARSSRKHMPDPDLVASAVTIFHIDSNTGQMASLDFFIENQDHRRAVVATLALMRYTYAEASQLIGNEVLLFRYVLKDMDLSKNEDDALVMNEVEFLALCRRLNFTRKSSAGKVFQELCKHYNSKISGKTAKTKNKLPVHDCLQLVQTLKGKTNPSVEAWRACFGKVKSVDAPTVLTKFLHGPQQEETICDLQDARDLINVMNATELGSGTSRRGTGSSINNNPVLTPLQFEDFLRSEWNDIYDPEKRVIDNQRLLNKPLSHYWINSSFLTSATSDGTPSVESYHKALLRGCKSIDLHCWDGAVLPNGDHVAIVVPPVGTGKESNNKESGKDNSKDNNSPGGLSSLKNKVTFQSVLLVVQKYLRDNRNSFPIMLNLVNNCSWRFQKAMAKSMKEVFGKHLFVPTTSDRKKELPSPEDLRGMIVVNAVRPSMRKRTLSMLESSKNLFSESSKEFSNNAYSKMFRKFNSKVERRSSRRLHDSGTFSVNYESTKSIKSVGGESEGDFKELTALFLFHEVNFSGYFLESMDQICSHMHDIKDTKVPMIVDMYSDNSTLWRKYNETHSKLIGSDPLNKTENHARLEIEFTIM